jgi:hypothetical protein
MRVVAEANAARHHVTSAIYGQVVINDAMVARYVPAHYRAKAYSVRYFLGFTASGFAAPMIALLYVISLHGKVPRSHGRRPRAQTPVTDNRDTTEIGKLAR